MKEKSLSLIEVTVAVTILALILGGMLGIFWQGSVASKSSQQRTIAYNLVREKLEEKSVWLPTSENRAFVDTVAFPGFERQVEMQSPYLGYANLAWIRVTVWWDNGNQSQAIETLKANY